MDLVITIDAEATHGEDPLKQMMWGHLPGESRQFGISLICDLCEKHGLRATFFLDVYEYSFYGQDAMRGVASYLVKRGHDVQLHTHPAWSPEDPRDSAYIQRMKRDNSCFDPERPWMYQYDLAEQTEIIRHGKELLEEWTGKPVVAHRSGGYGFNRDTLVALGRNEISVDSSMFPGHPNCQYAPAENVGGMYEGILEIPITFLTVDYYFDFLLFEKYRMTRRSKTDIDNHPIEFLKYFVSAGKEQGQPGITLFMHSYSFLKFDRRFSRFSPDHEEIDKFDQFLSWCVKESSLEYRVMSDYAEAETKSRYLASSCDRFLPQLKHAENIFSKIMLKAKRNVGRL